MLEHKYLFNTGQRSLTPLTPQPQNVNKHNQRARMSKIEQKPNRKNR